MAGNGGALDQLLALDAHIQPAAAVPVAVARGGDAVADFLAALESGDISTIVDQIVLASEAAEPEVGHPAQEPRRAARTAKNGHLAVVPQGS